ncbi:hypothetical protein SSBG_00721 [Streptomyces sp. SPB074]|nr:hypothetical protein SSBG_00721 [Streptomyces sp. SPB074]
MKFFTRKSALPGEEGPVVVIQEALKRAALGADEGSGGLAARGHGRWRGATRGAEALLTRGAERSARVGRYP